MPADTKAQPAPFKTMVTQAGEHATACGVNSSYAYLNSFTSDSAMLQKEALWSKLTLKPQLETQIKRLPGNINPKMHVLNYSADVNPFFIVALGLLMQISNESKFESGEKVIWR